MLWQRLVDAEFAVKRFRHMPTTVAPRARLIVENASGIRRRALPAMILSDAIRNVLVGTGKRKELVTERSKSSVSTHLKTKS